jgi:asparagine synthase (glutamine-hydrolysing)
MCGILAIINNTRATTTKSLAAATAVISHRGPDDEGFLTWSPGDAAKIYAGKDTAPSTRAHWQYPDLPADASFKTGLGHRRLSILDLSPAGHQPMIYEKAGLAITFNGEVYNYLEIKAELEVLGHHFHSTSDTEVLLHAWEEWGPECLNDFNGMFAFVILDYEKNELFACRDRFGVKPLYYYRGKNSTYFASEIKQIRTSPDYKFELNETIARQFLAIGASEHTDNTFDTNIKQVPAGHYLHVDLSTEAPVLVPEQWYTLMPHKWHGSFADAVDKFRQLLTDAIKLRLRSDVKVGSCLSGGLDSSSIVCIAADLLRAKGDFVGQETVTACFDDTRYDEWNFAVDVIKKSNAHPHRVFPSFQQLAADIDKLLWHQDEPFATTSVFSQWSVFKTTHEAGLKVMVDGQGADEQLAGYGGDDLPFYTGLLNKGHLSELYDEALYYKKRKGVWPKGFLLGALQLNLGEKVSNLFPEKIRVNKGLADVAWLSTPQPGSLYNASAHSLSENMLRQVYKQPLPALLRYEDHNSMAWSVESRTPFMDYRLLEFNLGLPERFIYKRGVRKHILREAMHGIIPESVENRRDKMGFVTPEEMWLKGVGKEWFLKGISKACKQFDGHLLDAAKVNSYVSEMIGGQRPFDSMPWRIVCFHRWFNSI